MDTAVQGEKKTLYGCHVKASFELFRNSTPREEYKDGVLLCATIVRLRLFSLLRTPWPTLRRIALPLASTNTMPRRAATPLTLTRIPPPGPCSLPLFVVVCWRLTLSLSRIKNPLAGIPKAQLLNDVERFARDKDMPEMSDLLKKGALVAQDPASFESIEELDENEKTALRREITHKWSQPRTLYLTVILCSVGAAVQSVFSSFLKYGFDH